MSVARANGLVLADLVLGQTLEHVAEGVRADLTDAAWRQTEPRLGVLDQTGVGQPAGELGEPLQRPHGVVAEQLADPFGVDLGERSRRRDAAQQRLQTVEFPELGHRVEGGAESKGIRAGEVVGGAPSAVRSQRPQLLTELADLLAQTEVVEECLGESGTARRAVHPSSN